MKKSIKLGLILSAVIVTIAIGGNSMLEHRSSTNKCIDATLNMQVLLKLTNKNLENNATHAVAFFKENLISSVYEFDGACPQSNQKEKIVSGVISYYNSITMEGW